MVRNLMETSLKRLSRTGLQKGFSEGSRAWIAVGVSATVVRILARLAVSKPERVFVTELQPGEGLEIFTLAPDRRSSHR